ncbi:delta 9-fatty acid desaturase protein [Dendrothele bispora CBS 962.96]|uniref:Acyl-CoA desaturase n=1 Tax=Dendrothele bispora (strain CBS 962.96) TaxID=1314807 RepID=A0A4S8MEB5_DENBC|nr:delta 9-fatty acid desaturase protein [Dendrothele bispora CBS 962.96]
MSLTQNFPKLRGIRWFNLGILVITPCIAAFGFLVAPLCYQTMLFSICYFIFTMLGITAGYHRLWSHRSYNASSPLQWFLLFGGTSALQGSCLWWSKAHRSHHRYTDTELDPYDSTRGLLWTHVGWMIFRTDLRSGAVDICDLRRDPLIRFQHNWYFTLAFVFGFFLPTIIPGLLWGDWIGGLCFATAFRMTLAHHSSFCINSIAHFLGSAPYDDKLTPRDNFISAILTMGEGYHNFHHQFPMDYRNAYLWYQWDPTKWFIAFCERIGLACQLRVFPSNEIVKGALTMKLKKLKHLQDSVEWPTPVDELPIVTFDTFQEESKSRVLILISGFIHDVSSFVDRHPGGVTVLAQNSGKDMTAAFFGGVYRHSNAAHNLLSMMRVGILAGGVETLGGHDIPPSQRLYIAERQPLSLVDFVNVASN